MHKFRSKFEQSFFKSLPANSVTYEDTKLKYIVPSTGHVYTPDFRIPNSNIFLETKGRFTAQDRKKMMLVIAQHPEKRIIMVFMNSALPISKGSKTTYADWCKKNGVEWMSVKEAVALVKQ